MKNLHLPSLVLATLTGVTLSTFTWNGENAIAADDLAAFQNAALKKHNEYRAKHGVPPLKLDSQLNAAAQQWANTLAAKGLFQHSGTNGQGENLYLFYSSSPDKPAIAVEADNAVTSWYNEIKDYNYQQPGFSAKTGHFTQVIWKSSTKLGCGIASGKYQGSYGRFVVCRYTSPGNYQGQFPQNVLPPT